MIEYLLNASQRNQRRSEFSQSKRMRENCLLQKGSEGQFVIRFPYFHHMVS